MAGTQLTQPSPMTTKSKFFRVATEGATTDGRAISREWITQMAKNFNPQKYGARIWLEHLRGIHPESSFRAYGDVLSVEARDVEDGKLGLFAQIQPLPELVDMVKRGQKIYTSIEVNPKFADSGEAYLTGLAVTDSPASLGTEILTFAAQKPEANPFKGRKSSPDALFSAAIEAQIELDDKTDDGAGLVKAFGDKLKGIVDLFTGKASGDDARFAQVADALGNIAAAVTEQVKGLVPSSQFATLKTAHDKLQADFTALQAKLAGTQDQQYSGTRPAATGSTTRVQTDC